MSEKLNINLLAQAWADVLSRQTGIKHVVTDCKLRDKDPKGQQKGA